METHIHTRGYTSYVAIMWESSMETHRHCGDPAWKHTLTQGDIHVLWESSIETQSHIHTRVYTSFLRFLLFFYKNHVF